MLLISSALFWQLCTNTANASRNPDMSSAVFSVKTEHHWWESRPSHQTHFLFCWRERPLILHSKIAWLDWVINATIKSFLITLFCVFFHRIRFFIAVKFKRQVLWSNSCCWKLLCLFVWLKKALTKNLWAVSLCSVSTLSALSYWRMCCA